MKMVLKTVLLLSTLLAVLLLAGCWIITVEVTLPQSVTHSFTERVHSLSLTVGAAEVTLQEGDGFAVESNLKHLTVDVLDGVLTITQEAKRGGIYRSAYLTLTVPRGTSFREVRLTTGAGKMTVDTLSADTLALEIGAGSVSFGHLTVWERATVKGGAGAVTVADGALHDLTMEMGLGELDLTARLTGDCDLSFGVGEANLALIGSREAYTLELEKGLGSITVDGKTVTDFGSSGSGEHRLEIEGGVGAVHLRFLTEP